MNRNKLLLLLVSSLIFASACSKPEADPNIGQAIARCTYVNSFSDKSECKEYFGSNWTLEAIGEDCARPVPGSDPGLVEMDLACDKSSILGQCVVDEGTVDAATIVFPGYAGDSCSGLATGCSFAGGEYVPAAACGGEDVYEIPPPSGEPFAPFNRVCVDPLPNEPVGKSKDGKVCTWEVISASTEEGRRYVDYASCEPVVKQRPYWPASAEAYTDPADARYSDRTWQNEFKWMTAQVESSACVCCHSSIYAPEQGPSGWYIEADGLWIDTLDDDGLAMLAGWIDSRAFGAFDPRMNNGFDRSKTGLPTTDPDRMKAFLEGELHRRGFQESDFAGFEPFGGPLADQLAFVPETCDDGIGVNNQGQIQWTGGPARYVYIMGPDSSNPGVPPNLDLPKGTIWRLDVSHTAAPVKTGITYGTAATAGSIQAWPEDNVAPAALISGQTYYLYVLQDIYIPLTRCLFEAP